MPLQGGPFAHYLAHTLHSYHHPVTEVSGHVAYWVEADFAPLKARWRVASGGNGFSSSMTMAPLVAVVCWSGSPIPCLWPAHSSLRVT